MTDYMFWASVCIGGGVGYCTGNSGLGWIVFGAGLALTGIVSYLDKEDDDEESYHDGEL